MLWYNLPDNMETCSLVIALLIKLVMATNGFCCVVNATTKAKTPGIECIDIKTRPGPYKSNNSNNKTEKNVLS